MSLPATLDHLADEFYVRSRAVILPGLRNSQYTYAELLGRAVATSTSWLDLGCGHGFVPSWVRESDRRIDTRGCRAVGIDQDQDALRRHAGLSLRVGGNIETLPFRDNTFDLVTANTVLEHVQDPARLFREISRVLAPGGRFLAHGPNSAGYTTLLTHLIPRPWRAPLAGWLLGRRAEDVYPTYYRANTARAFQRLARTTGLTVVECATVNSSPQLKRVPPLCLLELMMLRAAATPLGARLRPCVIVTLRKPLTAAAI